MNDVVELYFNVIMGNRTDRVINGYELMLFNSTRDLLLSLKGIPESIKCSNGLIYKESDNITFNSFVREDIRRLIRDSMLSDELVKDFEASDVMEVADIIRQFSSNGFNAMRALESLANEACEDTDYSCVRNYDKNYRDLVNLYMKVMDLGPSERYQHLLYAIEFTVYVRFVLQKSNTIARHMYMQYITYAVNEDTKLNLVCNDSNAVGIRLLNARRLIYKFDLQLLCNMMQFKSSSNYSGHELVLLCEILYAYNEYLHNLYDNSWHKLSSILSNVIGDKERVDNLISGIVNFGGNLGYCSNILQNYGKDTSYTNEKGSRLYGTIYANTYAPDVSMLSYAVDKYISAESTYNSVSSLTKELVCLINSSNTTY